MSEVFVANLNTPSVSLDLLIAHEVVRDEHCLLMCRCPIRPTAAMTVRNVIAICFKDEMIKRHLCLPEASWPYRRAKTTDGLKSSTTVDQKACPHCTCPPPSGVK